MHDSFGTHAQRGKWPVDRPSLRRALHGASSREMVLQAAIALAVALLLRAPLFGNPILHSDEQYYLLVGDRMLHGALPYVDLWDRKPIGLFLIYAAIRLLGGSGIVEYQVVATLSAAATAVLIMRLGRRIAAPAAALCAGLLYLVWLMIFNGAGGQSPVFYNGLVAGAALLLVREVERPIASRARLRATGLMAMALIGLAMQVKYTVVFEGIFFGLWLMWRHLMLGGGIKDLGLTALAWCLTALAPALAALTVYTALGRQDAFVYANFVSIFGRGGDDVATLASRLLFMIIACSPLIACVMIARGRRGAVGSSAVQHFLWGWLIAAVGGVLIFGSYYDHYALPILAPLIVLGAPALTTEPRRGGDARPGAAALIVAAIGLVGAAAAVETHLRERGTTAQIDALAAIIAPQLHGCLYLFGSEPILYHVTHACMVTPYAFRSHLSQAREGRAIGVDPVAEEQRLLAARPSVIVLREARANVNPATLHVLEGVLARHYRRVGAARVGSSIHIVYRRTD